MGATTGIEWADATVNVWEGCTKISPACKHCYAEINSPVRAMEVRIGEALQVEPSADSKRRLKMWGASGFRYETANWEAQLRALNRKAKRIGKRIRAFINSLSDTFEDWLGPVYRLEDVKPIVIAQSLDDVRTRFFQVAEECTELDILLLTKRPKNVKYMCPAHWYIAKWPTHVWLGTTVENQEYADERIPELLKAPAKVRFLSVEPLLGQVDLDSVCLTVRNSDTYNALRGYRTSYQSKGLPGECSVGVMSSKYERIHWVIVGGESGTNARPMHPDWVRSIRDQCQAAGVPFFFKQWGEWVEDHYASSAAKTSKEWGDCTMWKVGKKNAGLLLDGREWNEVPR